MTENPNNLHQSDKSYQENPYHRPRAGARKSLWFWLLPVLVGIGCLAFGAIFGFVGGFLVGSSNANSGVAEPTEPKSIYDAFDDCGFNMDSKGIEIPAIGIDAAADIRYESEVEDAMKCAMRGLGASSEQADRVILGDYEDATTPYFRFSNSESGVEAGTYRLIIRKVDS